MNYILEFDYFLFSYKLILKVFLSTIENGKRFPSSSFCLKFKSSMMESFSSSTNAGFVQFKEVVILRSRSPSAFKLNTVKALCH